MRRRPPSSSGGPAASGSAAPTAAPPITDFFGLGTGPHAPPGAHDRRRPPGDLRLRGQRRDAAGDRARRARRLPDRRRRHRRLAPRRAAPLGDGHGRGRHGPAGHPRHRRRRAQRLRRHQGRSTTSTPTRPGPTIEAIVAQSQKRSAVFDIIANPTNIQVTRRLTARPMRTPVVVIGAGQAGLAMSRQPPDRSIDHVVLDRGEVAHSWRTERWDSLRLLTPNWMSRLPGHRYDGPDPDGFMGSDDVVELLERLRGAASARRSTPTSTSPRSGRRGRASTWCPIRAPGRATPSSSPPERRSEPHVPALAAELPATHPPADGARATATRRSSPTAGCWWSARRPRACRSPTSCAAAAATW